MFANNVSSMFCSLRTQLRHMVASGRGGAIVNIGSIAGLTGLPGNPACSASKHAVVGLTQNAAIDYAPFGIRVNSLNMAQTATLIVFRAFEFVKWMEAQGGGASMAGAMSQSLPQMADHGLPLVKFAFHSEPVRGVRRKVIPPGRRSSRVFVFARNSFEPGRSPRKGQARKCETATANRSFALKGRPRRQPGLRCWASRWFRPG